MRQHGRPFSEQAPEVEKGSGKERDKAVDVAKRCLNIILRAVGLGLVSPRVGAHGKGGKTFHLSERKVKDMELRLRLPLRRPLARMGECRWGAVHAKVMSKDYGAFAECVEELPSFAFIGVE